MIKISSKKWAARIVVGLTACLALNVRAAELYLSGPLAERIDSATQDWGELGLDTAAHPPGQSALKLQIKDKKFARGLGQHANGELIVNLDGEFKTFQADIGVQWQGGQNVAAVVFKIFTDGREIFKSGVMHEQDPAQPVSVPVGNAQELRLVAIAAADGINCDAADWAEARLLPDPAAVPGTSDKHINVAPFAQVLWWDPFVTNGTRATRVQEMPAEDIFPARELTARADGSYEAPVTNGAGCLGLQWAENRLLRRVALEFPPAGAMPEPGSVDLQYWTGESAWQGHWQSAQVTPAKSGRQLSWALGYSKTGHGTPKVRWVFARAAAPLTVKTILAFTGSIWNPADIRLESENPGQARVADIDVYNGAMVNPPHGEPYHITWDGAQPLSLKVMSSIARAYQADRTVLRFRYPDTAFAVAVEDVLASNAVYVPHAGLFLTPNPAPVSLQSYRAQIAARRTVREAVRARPDQQFSNAWAAVHRPVEDLEPTMLSLACDNRKFIVRRDGAMGFDEYNRPDDPAPAPPNWNWLGLAQWQLIPRFGSGQNSPLTRSLEGGWLPRPVTTVTEGPIAYTQSAFVAPDGKTEAGHPAWWRERALGVIEYRVKNNGKVAAPVRFSFTLAPGRDPKREVEFQQRRTGLVAVSQGRVIALIDTRDIAPLAVTRQAAGIVLAGSLPAGTEVVCPVYVPAWKVAPDESAALLLKNSWAAAMEDYWKTLFAPAMQIEIPEAHLNNIIRASQVSCAIAARNEDHGARVAPWIASAFYGPLESEANSIIRGMDLTGHTDFARRSLDYFLGNGNAAGFITTGYTLVGTGEVLWTLGESYQRTHDRAWLKRHAPEIVRICQWIIRQRDKTKRLDAHGDKAPEYGLMPPGVTADWDRFAYRYFNDAQYCAGLEWAGRALADIDDPAAPGIVKDAIQYQADIARAFHWTQARTPVNPLANGTWVPADPSFLNCFGRIEDFYPGEDAGRTWCYSIECGSHHLAANRVLDPMSDDAGWMADYLEDVQFLRDGWGGDYPTAKNHEDFFDLGGFAKVQPYYCRLAEIYAMRDDVKPFIRAYLNAIPSLVNGENLTFCEHFHNYGAWNKTHETGWFLCQTRLMFVLERGDELWLAPLVSSDWLQDGKRIRVQNAPTQFGPAGYEIKSAAAKNHIDAVVQAPGCTARRIVLRLRHPEGKPIRSVTLQGKRWTDFDPRKETITFPPESGRIAVRASY